MGGGRGQGGCEGGAGVKGKGCGPTSRVAVQRAVMAEKSLGTSFSASSAFLTALLQACTRWYPKAS